MNSLRFPGIVFHYVTFDWPYHGITEGLRLA